jgi:hypothetical protein
MRRTAEAEASVDYGIYLNNVEAPPWREVQFVADCTRRIIAKHGRTETDATKMGGETRGTMVRVPKLFGTAQGKKSASPNQVVTTSALD